MHRPIRNGRDPFGRAFVFDLSKARKKWRIQDHNRQVDCVTKRKSLPSTVMKAV